MMSSESLKNRSGSSSQVQGAQPFQNTIPKIRQNLLKWNGWGYKDSGFKEHANNIVTFEGSRYFDSGPMIITNFYSYIIGKLGENFKSKVKCVPEPREEECPKSLVVLDLNNGDFLRRLEKLNISYSLKGTDRLFRSHGHTFEDIYQLRTGEWERIPDIVIWPENHPHVLEIINLAKEVNYAVIPFGGGTSVTHALKCSKEERRPIISLDTSQMCRILKVDEENLTCTAEAGIIGQDLETQLKGQGYTMGHEPDSYEFSSLGGWVATRASGMKKNKYGNIEDLLLHTKLVTPMGVIEKYTDVAPRISVGPDVHHLILGSEGTLGVITEVTFKIRPLPKIKRYGSIVFPQFSNGVKCLREIAKHRCQPSSIRLMDNGQVEMGKAIRPESSGVLNAWKESFKTFYLTKWMGYQEDRICIATILFEGDEDEVRGQEGKIYEIASKYGGISAGETNGQRGYSLTFVIAYIRDFCLDLGIYAESFETSISWEKVEKMCENVKSRVTRAANDDGIESVVINCRVTQTYDSGCCVYFYMAIAGKNILDPVKTYSALEEIARDEVLASGGTLSHHHGVGKIRKKWVPQTMSNCAIETLKNVKKVVDPQNIFACQNIFENDPHAKDGF